MIDIEEKLRRLAPFIDKKRLNGYWLMYLASEGLWEKKEIETMVDMLLNQKTGIGFAQEIILTPPTQKEIQGEIQLGTIKYCNQALYDFGIRKEDMIKHTGIFGQTGSGKTTACMNILTALAKEKVPFMLFDWKRNYRDLLTHPAFKEEEILIFTVGKKTRPFYFNPKQGPRDVEDPIWQKKLMEIIEKAYLLGPGATDVLMDAMEFPTFSEMKTYIDKQRRRGREMLWHMSSKRALNSICFPGLNEVVNSGQVTPVEDLLTKNVILELDGLSDTDKTFLIGSLLLWIYYFRLGQPERETLKHVTVIEEAHHLLLKEGRKEDITDTIMREIREFGEALIILDQHPHKISVSALGNCFTKIGFSTSLSQDIVALSHSMLLDFGQRRYFGMLQLGEAIVKSGRTPFPFLVKVPLFPITKGAITDEEVAQTSSTYSYQKEGLPPLSTGFQSQRNTESIPPAALILLQDIALTPLLGTDARYKRLGLNPREGNALQTSLIEAHLVQARWVDRRKLMELTSEGLALLETQGLLRPKAIARGGVEHNYFVEKIQKLSKEKGFQPFVEKENIDLIVQGKGYTIAIEVETGKSDIKKNIEALSKVKAEKRYMVATNKKAEERIKKIAATHNDIQVLVATDFLKLIEENLLTPSCSPETSEASASN